MHKYLINIFFSRDDGGFIADIPDLKYCSAFGKTPAEALKQVEIAKSLWMESAKAHKKRVPKPKHRPAIYAVAS